MPAFKPAPHLKGLKVRMKHDISARNGTKFPKGAICTVQYADTRHLHLIMRNPDPNNIFGPQYLHISHVDRYDVEWFTPNKLEPPAPDTKPKRARRAPEEAPPKEDDRPPVVVEDDIQTALNNLDDDD